MNKYIIKLSNNKYIVTLESEDKSMVVPIQSFGTLEEAKALFKEAEYQA